MRDRREKVIAVLLLAAGSTPTPCRDRIPSNLVSLSSQFRSFLFFFFWFCLEKAKFAASFGRCRWMIER